MYNLQGACFQPHYLLAELYTEAIINHDVGSHYHGMFLHIAMYVLL